jgi:MFS superfamily sulfate permease-like transporter
MLSAILCWQFRWDEKGLEILGDIKTNGNLFPIHWPFGGIHLKYASDTFSTSFLIALLGFFESSVAAKSLGLDGKKGLAIQNMHLSANRELVALGTANVVGGLFMALPAFGGYGRSKVNASTGGKTPMSSIFLALITLLSILFLTPYFYYLPVSQPAYLLGIDNNALFLERSAVVHDFRGRLFSIRRDPS